jgi:hypothetical protein
MKKQPFAIPLKIRLRAPSATHYRHLAGVLWLDLGRGEKGSERVFLAVCRRVTALCTKFMNRQEQAKNRKDWESAAMIWLH